MTPLDHDDILAVTGLEEEDIFDILDDTEYTGQCALTIAQRAVLSCAFQVHVVDDEFSFEWAVVSLPEMTAPALTTCPTTEEIGNVSVLDEVLWTLDL